VSTFDIDAADFLAGFDAAIDRMQSGAELAVEDTVSDVHDDMRALVPVDTGELRDAIYHEVRVFRASVRGEVGTRGAQHAVVVEFGSQPHTIRPRRGRVLRWVDETGEHFARVVHHPGTRPSGFFRASWARAPGIFRRNVAGRFGGGR
jgi:hypothetical protein